MTNHDFGTHFAYTEVTADEKCFPGITKIEESLRSWQWIYGKTPRFIVNKELLWDSSYFSIQLHVFHGVIEKLWLSKYNSNLDLTGTQFIKDLLISRLNESLNKIENNYNFEKFLCESIISCLDDII